MTDSLITALIARIPRPDFAPPDPPTGEVPPEEVAAVIAAGRVAPSADNLQPWRFVVVRDKASRRLLAGAVPDPMAPAVRAAPVVLVACGVKALVTRIRREQPFVAVDVPIAVTHLLLQAAEIGLSTAWTLDVDETLVRGVLAIPADVRVVAIVALAR